MNLSAPHRNRKNVRAKLIQRSVPVRESEMSKKNE